MQVLIVGCGLAGLAAALSLTSSNNNDDDDDIQITIVEKRRDLESKGATFGLQINGQNALNEIAGSSSGSGKNCAMLDKLINAGLLIPSSGGYMLPWWTVRDTLLEEVQARNDKIKIHLGVSLDAVSEQDDGSYIVTFKDDPSLQINADLIIGADGVHSYVRREILSLPRATPSGAYVWRGSVDTNNASAGLKPLQEAGNKLFQFGGGIIMALFNFHPKVVGQIAWVVTVRVGMLPDNMTVDCGKTTPIDLIQAYMDSSADENAADDEELKKNYELAMLVLNNTHQPSDLTWSSEMGVVDLNQQEETGWGGKGRITLIGDAAHAIRPASGLGGSLAFEDAAMLGRYIARSNTSNAAFIEEQLRAFEKIRLPRCKSISNDQSIRAELSYKVGFGGVPAWDKAYEKWVQEGIDSSPEPPVSEMDVLADLLSD